MVNRCLFALSLIAGPAMADPITLNWPIDCTLNETCFIQQYMDVDDSKDARDFMGGQATYDGHKGTDIRLASHKAMQDGVNVLASVAGQVKGLRNTMVDRLVRTDADRAAIKDKDCGNGVVIDHEDGWETQYCHMKQGSIMVVKGQMVQVGEVLGQVGLSGRTQFPHIHIAVRKDGQKLDPFAPDANLWAAYLQEGLAYQPTQIINIGFAGGAVSVAAIEDGTFDGFIPSRTTRALVGYVRALNLEKGDYIRLTLTGPDGVISNKIYDPAPNTRATQMYFAGKKAPRGGWPEGDYNVKAEVVRGIDSIEVEMISVTIQ